MKWNNNSQKDEINLAIWSNKLNFAPPFREEKEYRYVRYTTK